MTFPAFRGEVTDISTSGPNVIRPFHFQKTKMKFCIYSFLFINSFRFIETKLPYCRNTDI